MQARLVAFVVKAVLFAAATAAMLRVLNVKTAAARHAGWMGVVVFMLLLPVWSLWGPKVPLRWLPPKPPFAEAPVG